MSILLELIEIVNGVLSLIFVLTSITIGIKLILKYFQEKDINILLAGIIWIILCEVFWAVSISFLLVVFTGKTLPLDVFFLIGFVFLPVGVQLWMVIMTNLMWKGKQKIIFIITGIIVALFETAFLYLLFIDISMLGQTVGTFDVRYELFMLVYLSVLLLILLTTGLNFAIESFKSKNPEIRLKGKFLLLSFLSFIIGGFLSILSGYSIIILVIAKIILILSAFEGYCGFILPDSIEKLFLKRE